MDNPAELIRGAVKSLENAEKIFNTANTIYETDLTTSYFLYQISIEECSKVEIFGTPYIDNYYFGSDFDLKKIVKKAISHENKNKENAYFLDLSNEELEARNEFDFKKQRIAFDKLQNDFHEKSNFLKNKSLYVDFDFENKKFVQPEDFISRDDLSKIKEKAKEFIKIMKPKVELLLKLEANPLEKKVDRKEFEEKLMKNFKKFLEENKEYSEEKTLLFFMEQFAMLEKGRSNF